tara:strand:- start:127 stop:447 length:321 start_codon:yes stop_codon:yes gene_type:complete
MENQTQIIYSPDYRSPPSGLGTISIGQTLILIQDNDNCSEVRDGIYNSIIKLEANVFEDFENDLPKLLQILRDHNVTHVYDSETADEHDIDNPKMELADWIHLIAG